VTTGGNSAGRSLGDELEKAFWVIEVPEPVLAEIPEHNLRCLVVAGGLPRRARDEDLATV
jgi:hypothetical protein